MRKLYRLRAALAAAAAFGTTVTLESFDPLEYSSLFAYWLVDLEDPVALCSFGEPEAPPSRIELGMSDRARELASELPLPFAPLPIPE